MRFQFLMVRLEEKGEKIDYAIRKEFQFLMVRLEGEKALLCKIRETCFNSLWFD